MVELNRILELFNKSDVLIGDDIIKSLMLLKDRDIEKFFQYYTGLNGKIYLSGGPVLVGKNVSYADWSRNEYTLTTEYKRIKKIDDIINL